jgi:hypothetical protein
MDLLSSPFSSLIQLQGQLSLQEQGVGSEIAALLREGLSSDSQVKGTHLKLEELRFSRNMCRYRLMDVEAVIKVRKQHHFESRVLEAFALLYPELNAEFQAELECNPFVLAGYDCPEIILQSVEACYRKIESSFNDQTSMLIQMSLSESRAQEMTEWFTRVNHALLKSKTFFSRQCSKARSLRAQFVEVYSNNAQHHNFCLLRARYGAGMVEQLAIATSAKMRKAA